MVSRLLVAVPVHLPMIFSRHFLWIAALHSGWHITDKNIGDILQDKSDLKRWWFETLTSALVTLLVESPEQKKQPITSFVHDRWCWSCHSAGFRLNQSGDNMTGRVGFPKTVTHSHNSGRAVVMTISHKHKPPLPSHQSLPLRKLELLLIGLLTASLGWFGLFLLDKWYFCLFCPLLTKHTVCGQPKWCVIIKAVPAASKYKHSWR